MKIAVPAFTIGCAFLLVFFLIMAAYAQPSPKPTPAIRSGFCVSNATGATRVELAKNGIVAACHKGEQTVPLLSLESAPTVAATPNADPTASASPAPGDPTPTATASADPTASASPEASCQGCVMDANGNEVGPLSTSSGEENLVLVTVGGVAMALPVAAGSPGWLGGQETGIPLTEFYVSNDCSGQPYMLVNDIEGPNNAPLQVDPLVEDGGGSQAGPYIYNTTVWYPQPPFAAVTFGSEQTFANPNGAGQCGVLQGSESFYAGPPASASLSSLGVAPFSVNP